jgi:hypothetical protein
MRPVLIALTLLAATTAFAQTDKTQEDKTQTEMRLQRELVKMRLQQELYGCPVGITAQHQGSPAAIWTTSLDDANKSAAELKKLHTGVHVDLNAPHKEIKQAELAVFFLPPGTRALPVAASQFTSSSAPAPETSKNFSLVAGSASHRLNGDLLLGPVASVTHISLMRVIYSDGTEWKARSSSSCSIEPSHFMRIESK